MKKSRLLLSTAVLCLPGMAANAEIVINEVMQSNVYTIMDDINEFPDSWVELYNAGNEALNIEGYRMNVKDKFKSAYSLPSIDIEPGATVLIYCDKVGEGLHADFRVDSGKGELFLYDRDGNVIDKLTLAKQPAPDVAYGRVTDGADEWGYQLTPTPGISNAGGVSEIVLGQVEFSVPGGVWKDARNIQVELTLPADAPEGSYIRYSVDGAEPTSVRGITYSGPISVDKSCVVRAKAFCEGAISRPSNAQSYLFLERDVQIPVISIAVNKEYLYDHYIGIFAEGPGGWNNENFRYDWRRPINIEFFDGEGEESVLNQLCETRVQGGYTRVNNLKSLALYANKRFGEKRFNHELWSKDKPGVVDNKSFILRNGGNDFDWCYVRDGLIQRVIGRNTVVDWQAYSPVIIFINGEYHAMEAIRERSNEDYVAANYDGLEDIDMWENWSELKEGDEESINEFSDYVYNDVHTFEEWQEYINVESYANLMAINYWVYNTDFPMNNTVMWRRTDGVDGRWQWLIKDCDFGLGIWNDESHINHDFHSYLYSNSVPSIGFDMYQKLMANDEFRDYYINRLIVYMGDFLNARTFNAYLDEIIDENHGEQIISHKKWGSWWSNLDSNIDFMRNWIERRENVIHTLAYRHFSLGKPTSVKVNNGLSDDQLKSIKITYNDVPLTQNTFDGFDYVGRTITLAGEEDSSIKGWTITVGEEEQTIMEPVLNYVIADNSDITINAIIDGTTGIESIESTSSVKRDGAFVYGNGFMEAYDMAGRKVADGDNVLRLPARGIYLIQSAHGTSKIAW